MATSAVQSNPAVFDSLNQRTDSTGTVITEAQNRFLTLLTTQIKNQDPLNPLDNAQMTSQLAQISTVDGIERLNKTLQTLLGNSADTQTLQAAALVGRGVLISGSGLSLVQGGALGGVELSAAADQVVVTIKDMNGLVVRTLDLGALDVGTHGFAWDGKSDSGATAADGAYAISVAAKRGQDTVTASPLQLGIVSSVARSGQGVSIDLGGLGRVTMDEVKQIL